MAIKVPHPRLVERPEDAESYLTEARTIANLDHPNIVPAHDGIDLVSRLRHSRLARPEGMRMAANYLQRTGYRLPTGAEWEYACRAGADTEFSFGEPEDLVGKYAWFAGNSTPSNSQPVGRLRPNDLGLEAKTTWCWKMRMMS